MHDMCHKPMKPRSGNSIIPTNDGSPTVMSGQFGTTYHSTHGAVQESQHVFLQSGLAHLFAQKKTALRIFEMGFGTGLNAWLTHSEAGQKELNIDYHSVELYPLSDDVVKAFAQKLAKEDIASFWQIHQASWDGNTNTISPNFSLTRYQMSILDLRLPSHIDLVYYDAFAPTAQPELWTTEVFGKLFAAMNHGAVLVTYCCKGDVRRAMISVGFLVEKIPGPPGKREMIRATKPLIQNISS